MSDSDRCRIHLVLGKGGVGKTTTAAALAAASAQAGAATMLVSVDQAHSLGDALDVAVATTSDWRSEFSPIELDPAVHGPATGTFDAVALDTRGLVEALWLRVRALASGHEHAAIEQFDAREIATLPGIEELAALAEIAAMARSGSWDAIIVDCPPTAESLRMLTLPDAALVYLRRLWPDHERVAAARSGDPRQLLLVTLVSELAQRATALRDLLADADGVRALLVTTPEKVAVAEAVRTVTALSLAGVALESIVLNRVLVQDDSYEYRNVPDHPAFRWYTARMAEQEQVRREVAELLETGGVRARLVEVPYTAEEPVGIPALCALGERLLATADSEPHGAAEPDVTHESGTGLDSIYLLRLQLPLLDPATLTLGRVDDDLVVGAPGVRRRVTLASVLRRCAVVDAKLVGTELQVRFRPIPEVWPT